MRIHPGDYQHDTKTIATSLTVSSSASLVPRPERGERAWYLLHVHAPTIPGKPGVTLLGFTYSRIPKQREKAQSDFPLTLCLSSCLGTRLSKAKKRYPRFPGVVGACACRPFLLFFRAWVHRPTL